MRQDTRSSIIEERRKQVNLTIDTIVSIEEALGAPILEIHHPRTHAYELNSMIASEPLLPPEKD